MARKNGGTWTHENALSAFAALDTSPCLAIDSQGNPHIAYKNISSGELVHGFKRGGQWSSTTVPPNPEISRFEMTGCSCK